jgi:hypothetical protein
LSRRETLEEKRDLRKVYLFLAAGFTFLIVFFFIGIPFLVDFSAYLSTLLSPKKTTQKKMARYIQQPQLEISYEATNSATIKITGFGAINTDTGLYINNRLIKNVLNKNGSFTFNDVNLTLGDNEVYVLAKDKTSDKEAKSEILTITYDNKKPEIAFDNLNDNQEFRLNNQITIKGKLNEDGTLYVNDRFILVNSDKTFSTDYQLNDGDNKLKFVVIDKAGNKFEKELTVKFKK